jgi:hypothetical protein
MWELERAAFEEVVKTGRLGAFHYVIDVTLFDFAGFANIARKNKHICVVSVRKEQVAEL